MILGVNVIDDCNVLRALKKSEKIIILLFVDINVEVGNFTVYYVYYSHVLYAYVVLGIRA